MYSKHAKYKQIANIDWLGLEIMYSIAKSNYAKENLCITTRADYYWNSQLGLYLIIDIIPNEHNVLNEFHGFKLLYGKEILGQKIWSNQDIKNGWQ